MKARARRGAVLAALLASLTACSPESFPSTDVEAIVLGVVVVAALPVVALFLWLVAR